MLCLILFQGIVKALQMYQQELIRHQVRIFVRRGGPNYQEGLRIMRDLGMYALISIKFQMKMHSDTVFFHLFLSFKSWA